MGEMSHDVSCGGLRAWESGEGVGGVGGEGRVSGVIVCLAVCFLQEISGDIRVEDEEKR